MGSDNIEDIYPLSPMQHGILFHVLCEPQSSVYWNQLSFTLRGPLDLEAFQQAWQKVIDRHASLRACFMWEGLEKPLQIIRSRVSVPWRVVDCRHLAVADRAACLDDLLRSDRAQGFHLSQAPVMRFALMRWDDSTHQFVWSQHHLLLDGWSFALVLKEVFALYEAIRNAAAIELPSSRPYRDFVSWWQHQPVGESESYWRRTLKGFTAPTPVPGRSLPDQSSSNGEAYGQAKIELSEAATAALQSLARQQRLTLSTVLQGAWAILLSRYSRQSDVVFGITVSGRPAALSGVESIVGLFINTLPFRAHVCGQSRLVPWLKGLQGDQLDLLQHQHGALVDIQGWSEVPRGLPLFESILEFENYPLDQAWQTPSPSLQVSDLRSDERTNYPLTLVVWPGPKLWLAMSYQRRHFEKGAIERMLGHLRRLLESMVANPDQSLGDLPLLTDPERLQLLDEWNRTRIIYPEDQCLHQLFEAQAERTPDRAAVECGSQTLTYRELHVRSNRLARALQDLGVGPDILVGLCVERSVEMVVALLGILKAGGAYVPLDPTYPRERLGYMMEDANVQVLVTQEQFLSAFPTRPCRILCVDAEEFCGDKLSGASRELVRSVRPDHLAYVLYTSGSTGQPKGVEISHRGVVSLLTSLRQSPGLDHDDILLSVSTLSFDIAAVEIFLPLTTGAKSVIVSREITMDGLQLSKAIDDAAATVMQATPATWQLLLESGWAGNPRLKIFCCGEPLSRALAGELLSRSAALWNLYGPTETTVYSTGTQIFSASQVITIGKPIGNTQTFILDPRLEPVPIGVVGELHIGGAGLARGYLNRPQLTRARFIPNPFGLERNARLYKTGDLARYLPDGNIEFVGRLDNQVKIRGFRIELGEIESVLNQYRGVRESIVLAREEDSADKCLIAYVRLVPKAHATRLELQGFLKEKLPIHMVPAHFMFLETFPLNPSGKIDRKALPPPELVQNKDGCQTAAPRTDLERQLAGIWCEVLNRERVGIHDNFFDLGAHSLLLMRAQTKISSVLGQEIPIASFFEHSSISALAQHLTGGSDVSSERPIRRGPDRNLERQRYRHSRKEKRIKHG